MKMSNEQTRVEYDYEGTEYVDIIYWGDVGTEAAIWSEGTKLSRDELVAMYRSHVDECIKNRTEPREYCGLFAEAIKGQECVTDDDAARIVARIDELNPCCPESVADRARQICGEEGLEAALVEVRRAYDFDCREIAKVLLSFGDTFSGGDDESAMSAAREWHKAGFGADEVDDWCSAGVWAADTAKALTEKGIEPGELFVVRRDLVYSACNGDKKVAELIAAIEE
jgi:hypothetical protein